MEDSLGRVAHVEMAARQALAATDWCHVLTGSHGVNVHKVLADLGPVTRRVRGRKMRTWRQLFDEFMAAWQFDEICDGDCSACFNDGIGDLYLQWPSAPGFAVVITEPEQVLADEHERFPKPHDYWLSAFVTTLEDTVELYSEPEDRDRDDSLYREALSFDVILVTNEEHRDAVVRLWRQAGAPLAV